MYLTFFGLRKKPFSITPDPRFLYLSQQHREGLAHLVYGTDETGSFALLTGEIGTGKTTLSRLLLEQVPDDVKIALILNPMQTPLELLKSICDELSVVYPNQCDSRKELVDNLNKYLLDVHSQNQRVVVIIDEAQNLDFETLEQIRLLTNLETSDHKLLKIILIGQPELRDMINQPDLKQLSQRITARYHLPPLNRKETGAYIRHRLKVAGGHPGIFSKAAIDALYKQSEGVPRLINIFAERALLGAYAKDKRVVDKRLVKKAVNELLGIRGKWEKAFPNLLVMVSITLALSALLLAAWGLLSERYNKTHTEPNIAVNSPIDRKPLIATTDIQEATNTPPTTTTKAANIDTDVINNMIKKPGKPDSNIQHKSTPIPPEQLFLETNEKQQPDLGKYLKTAGHSQQAYTALFTTWGENFQTTSSKTSCEQAKDVGLECMYSDQGMEQLKAYNLPAILELKDEEGKRKLAMIQSVTTDGNVTLLIDGHQFLSPESELDKLWDGQFLLLWRLPPGKEATLKNGMQGESIRWLVSQLGQLSNKPLPYSLSKFNLTLKARVIEFQKTNKLKPDGIAGPDTLIKIVAQSNQEETPDLFKTTVIGDD